MVQQENKSVLQLTQYGMSAARYMYDPTQPPEVQQEAQTAYTEYETQLHLMAQRYPEHRAELSRALAAVKMHGLRAGLSAPKPEEYSQAEWDEHILKWGAIYDEMTTSFPEAVGGEVFSEDADGNFIGGSGRKRQFIDLRGPARTTGGAQESARQPQPFSLTPEAARLRFDGRPASPEELDRMEAMSASPPVEIDGQLYYEKSDGTLVESHADKVKPSQALRMIQGGVLSGSITGTMLGTAGELAEGRRLGNTRYRDVAFTDDDGFWGPDLQQRHYLPNLTGDAVLDEKLIQNPWVYRDVLEAAQRAKKRDRFGLTFGQVAVGMGEFIPIARATNVAARGAGAVAGRAVSASPLGKFLSTRGAALGQAVAGRPRTITGIRQTVSEVPYEAVYGALRQGLSNSDFTGGAVQGFWEGMTEAGLGTLARGSRAAIFEGATRLGMKLPQGQFLNKWGNRLRERRDQMGLPGGEQLQSQLGKLDALAEQGNLTVTAFLKQAERGLGDGIKRWRRAGVTQDFLLQMYDTAIVGASVGGWAGAQRIAAEEGVNWDELDLGDKLARAWDAKSSPEALGTVAGMIGGSATVVGLTGGFKGKLTEEDHQMLNRFLDAVRADMDSMGVETVEAVHWAASQAKGDPGDDVGGIVNAFDADFYTKAPAQVAETQVADRTDLGPIVEKPELVRHLEDSLPFQTQAQLKALEASIAALGGPNADRVRRKVEGQLLRMKSGDWSDAQALEARQEALQELEAAAAEERIAKARKGAQERTEGPSKSKTGLTPGQIPKWDPEAVYRTGQEAADFEGRRGGVKGDPFDPGEGFVLEMDPEGHTEDQRYLDDEADLGGVVTRGEAKGVRRIYYMPGAWENGNPQELKKLTERFPDAEVVILEQDPNTDDIVVAGEPKPASQPTRSFEGRDPIEAEALDEAYAAYDQARAEVVRLSGDLGNDHPEVAAALEVLEDAQLELDRLSEVVPTAEEVRRDLPQKPKPATDEEIAQAEAEVEEAASEVLNLEDQMMYRRSPELREAHRKLEEAMDRLDLLKESREPEPSSEPARDLAKDVKQILEDVEPVDDVTAWQIETAKRLADQILESDQPASPEQIAQLIAAAQVSPENVEDYEVPVEKVEAINLIGREVMPEFRTEEAQAKLAELVVTTDPEVIQKHLDWARGVMEANETPAISQPKSKEAKAVAEAKRMEREVQVPQGRRLSELWSTEEGRRAFAYGANLMSKTMRTTKGAAGQLDMAVKSVGLMLSQPQLADSVIAGMLFSLGLTPSGIQRTQGFLNLEDGQAERVAKLMQEEADAAFADIDVEGLQTIIEASAGVRISDKQMARKDTQRFFGLVSLAPPLQLSDVAARMQIRPAFNARRLRNMPPAKLKEAMGLPADSPIEIDQEAWASRLEAASAGAKDVYVRSLFYGLADRIHAARGKPKGELNVARGAAQDAVSFLSGSPNPVEDPQTGKVTASESRKEIAKNKRESVDMVSRSAAKAAEALAFIESNLSLDVDPEAADAYGEYIQMLGIQMQRLVNGDPKLLEEILEARPDLTEPEVEEAFDAAARSAEKAHQEYEAGMIKLAQESGGEIADHVTLFFDARRKDMEGDLDQRNDPIAQEIVQKGLGEFVDGYLVMSPAFANSVRTWLDDVYVSQGENYVMMYSGVPFPTKAMARGLHAVVSAYRKGYGADVAEFDRVSDMLGKFFDGFWSTSKEHSLARRAAVAALRPLLRMTGNRLAPFRSGDNKKHSTVWRPLEVQSGHEEYHSVKTNVAAQQKVFTDQARIIAEKIEASGMTLRDRSLLTRLIEEGAYFKVRSHEQLRDEFRLPDAKARFMYSMIQDIAQLMDQVGLDLVKRGVLEPGQFNRYRKQYMPLVKLTDKTGGAGNRAIRPITQAFYTRTKGELPSYANRHRILDAMVLVPLAVNSEVTNLDLWQVLHEMSLTGYGTRQVLTENDFEALPPHIQQFYTPFGQPGRGIDDGQRQGEQRRSDRRAEINHLLKQDELPEGTTEGDLRRELRQIDRLQQKRRNASTRQIMLWNFVDQESPQTTEGTEDNPQRVAVMDMVNNGYVLKTVQRDLALKLEMMDAMESGLNQTVNQIFTMWKQRLTIFSPRHWAMNMVGILSANDWNRSVPWYDFVTSLATGKGYYARAADGIDRVREAVQDGRLSFDNKGKPTFEGEKDPELYKAALILQKLEGATFADQVALANTGESIVAQQLRAAPDLRLAFGSSVDQNLVSATVGGMSAAVSARESLAAGASGRTVPELRRDIDGVQEAYRDMELLGKMAASFSALDDFLGRGMNLEEAIQRSINLGAASTADYSARNPTLIELSGMLNLPMGNNRLDRASKATGGKEGSDMLFTRRNYQIMRSMLRAFAATPFLSYSMLMTPRLIRSGIRNPTRSTISAAMVYAISQLLMDDDDEALMLDSIARTVEGGLIEAEDKEKNLVFEVAPGSFLYHVDPMAEKWQRLQLGRMLTISLPGPKKFGETTRLGIGRYIEGPNLPGQLAGMVQGPLDLLGGKRDEYDPALGAIPMMALGTAAWFSDLFEPQGNRPRSETWTKAAQAVSREFIGELYPGLFPVASKGGIGLQESMGNAKLADQIAGIQSEVAKIQPLEKRLQEWAMSLGLPVQRSVGQVKDPRAVTLLDRFQTLRGKGGGGAPSQETDEFRQAFNRLKRYQTTALRGAYEAYLEDMSIPLDSRLEWALTGDGMEEFIRGQDPAAQQFLREEVAKMGLDKRMNRTLGVLNSVGRTRQIPPDRFEAFARATFDEQPTELLAYLHRVVKSKPKQDVFGTTYQIFVGLSDTWAEVLSTDANPGAKKKYDELLEMYRPYMEQDVTSPFSPDQIRKYLEDNRLEFLNTTYYLNQKAQSDAP